MKMKKIWAIGLITWSALLLVFSFAVMRTYTYREQPTPISFPLREERDTLVPEEGTVLHGVWLPPVGGKISARAITRYENICRKRLGAHLYYVGLHEDSWEWVSEQLAVLDTHNIRAHIVLEPWDGLDAILNGSQDTLIDVFAEGAHEYGKPFFLRFAHEANGNWYPWSGAMNDNDPEKYIAAWKYVWERFDAIGADNVVWVWAVNWSSVPDEAWNAIGNYYPGHEYVDWVGVDFYGLRWDDVPVSKNINPMYPYFSHKPIMIAEVAAADCNNYFAGATRGKDEWIEEFFATLLLNPEVRAFFWFNENKAEEADWRINSCPSPDALEAYKDGIAHSRYVGRQRFYYPRLRRL